MGLGSLFGGDDPCDAYDEFRPDHLPEPGAALADHDVLTGREHCAFHRLTRDLFEERTVYDATFGYNLARLNLDTRHPDAGYRYAVDAAEPSVLWAEFTPTTPFCPQTHTLAVGSFRAWNALADRHEYDLVRVRADGTHHRSGAINEQLRGFEEAFRETGTVPGDDVADAPGEGGADVPGPVPGPAGGRDAPF